MNDLDPVLVAELSQNFEIDLPSQHTMEELRTALTSYVNHLIGSDPAKLMQILYRIDVEESSLKKNLADQANAAGDVIADMIIARQLQKIEAKKKYRSGGNIPEDEKW